MTTQNFAAMTRKELLNSLLIFLHNQRFYAYIDKVNAKSATKFYSASESI